MFEAAAQQQQGRNSNSNKIIIIKKKKRKGDQHDPLKSKDLDKGFKHVQKLHNLVPSLCRFSKNKDTATLQTHQNNRKTHHHQYEKHNMQHGQ